MHAVADAVTEWAVVVTRGDPGLGKTFAVQAALQGIWVSYLNRPTPRLIARRLLERPTRRGVVAAP
jgi:hypothetical protein